MTSNGLSLTVGDPGRAPVALLVDPDADTREMYAEVLRKSGYEIDEAEDGREALARAISRPPDVIVTETRLPGISGFDLCGLLRSDAATSKIPVVFVTGDAFTAEVTRAEGTCAAAVLVKPCLPEQLAAAIRAVLKGSQKLDEKITAQMNGADTLIANPKAIRARKILSRAHHRHETTTPPSPPPTLVCPRCDQPLRYVKSHVGGVSAHHQERWDYFDCAAGCGTFQYRMRTRKLRRVK